jgi:RecJ-like exonuclease
MMQTIKCPRCKGKGEVRDSVVTNPLIVICTLGVSLALTDCCPVCDGKGCIKVSI